ncbi:Coiled-coil domain-containing protein 51 [Aphelenchoides bicaudatus]|nr:Coiled-coil domain-containing protein 51 [Aphelenchoides bicaudatus]
MASLLGARFARSLCLNQRRHSSQLKKSMESAVAYYNDVIGITEVTKAKADVISCESSLSNAQLQRREKQFELRKLQSRLKEIHSELDRTPRGDDRYLYLLTEEHAIIKKEQAVMDEFEVLENYEREAFHELSNKVRVSHEKEREREERTKYWSITASLIGALMGIIGATISNEVRMRNLRKMIPMSDDVRKLFDEIAQTMHSEQKQITEFITEMKSIFRLDSPKLAALSLKEPNDNAQITKQLEELKRLTALDQALGKDPNTVVYVGDDMELLLKQTEENIESKIKIQTLATVVLAYGLIALGIPLIYYLWNN